MRVLITSVGAYGHLHPLMPVAQGLVEAGHEVALATGPDIRSRAEAAGYTTFEAGLPLRDAFERLVERYPAQEYNRLLPEEILSWYVPHLFGELLAPAVLDDLEPLVQSWRPDVILHDIWEMAGPIAAAGAGVPSISHTLGPRFADRIVEAAATAVAPLWQRRGLAPDPTAGMYRHLCLDITPPGLQPSRRQVSSRSMVQPLRPVAPPPLPGEELPEWVDRRGRGRPATDDGRPTTEERTKLQSPVVGGRSSFDKPLVYMTLGTNTNTGTEVFRSVIEGLGGLEIDVLITLGPGKEGEVARLREGGAASNVHVESYVPQSLLLPHCSAVVCHSGAGTTLNALALGLPLLALPQGADQYVIGDLVAASGAGLLLKPSEVDSSTVRSSVLALLHDPRYKAAAGRIEEEIAAMPGPQESVRLIEQLAYVK